jgi:hypothetical protein
MEKIMIGISKAKSKAEAKALGLRRYFTGIQCIHGHISERNVASGMCLTCAASYRRDLLKSNPALRVKNGRRTPEQKKQHAEYMRKRNAENPDITRSINLKNNYGISQHDYDLILTSQGGVCAICMVAKIGNSKHVNLFVDHCHESTTVRGLLCHNCNAMLGHAKDNPSVLRSAADYLERVSGDNVSRAEAA